MRYYKLSLILLVFLLYPIVSMAQLQHFVVVQNTGQNCTVLVPTSANPVLDGAPLGNLDEIGIFNSTGDCCGAKAWTVPTTNKSIAVYGAVFDPVPMPGMQYNELFQFHVWDYSANVETANVTVTFAAGNGRYSPNSSHRLASLVAISPVNIPNPPVLTYPLDGANNIPLDLTFTWNAVTSASGYDFALATDAGFTNIIASANNTNLTSYNYNGLSYGTTYYWHVRSKNSAGNSAWTSASFTTVQQIILTPPFLNYPANGMTVPNPAFIDFIWQPVLQALTYDIQIATDPYFINIVHSATGLSNTTTNFTNFNFGTQYFWHVRAENGSVIGPWSDMWNFWTIVAAPLPPTIIYPSIGATGMPLNLQTQWSVVVGALDYEFQAATDAGFLNIIVSGIGLTNNFFDLTNLNYSTTYNWRVRAHNDGGYSAWTVAYFTTMAPAALPPPILSYPNNGAINQPTSLNVSWYAVPEATSYHLQVATNVDFTAGLQDFPVLVNTSELLTLNLGTTYYWRVDASNNLVTSPWSQTWSFSTLPNPPAAPAIVYPINGATMVPTNLVFEWSSVANADAYEFILSASPTFDPTVATYTGSANSFQVLYLNQNTVYYWEVRAINAGGNSSWTEASFTTTFPMNPIQLYYPLNGNQNIPVAGVTLAWMNDFYAMGYQVEVATDANFTNIFLNQNVTTPLAFTGALTFETTYWWRVRGNYPNAGFGPWSDQWSFTTVPGAPVAPVLTYPADGAINVPLTLNLLWDASQFATGYDIQVSTQADFSTLLYDVNNNLTTNLSISGLLNSTTYYWRVRARNLSGESDWASASFTTVGTGPYFQVIAQTGVNCQVLVPTSANPVINGAPMQPGDEIGIFNSEGLCCGARDWNGVSNRVITVWGAVTDPLPMPGMGYLEPFQFRIYQASTGLVFTNVTVTYSQGNGLYSTNSTHIVASLSAITPPPVPDAPQIIYPLSGAINIPYVVNLQWSASTGATGYDMIFATDPGYVNITHQFNNQFQTSYQIQNLAAGTTYYWKVRARNIGGTSAWTEATFTTIPGGPHFQSVPSTGINCTVLVPLTANPVINGQPMQPGDEIGIFNSNGDCCGTRSWTGTSNRSITVFGAVTDPIPLPGMGYNEPFLFRVWSVAQGIEYTNVAVTYAAGNGLYSTNSLHRLASLVAGSTQVPPAAPGIQSPINGATGVSVNPLLTWYTSVGATSYDVELAADAAYTNIIFSAFAITTNSAQVTGLSNYTTYYWRVRATNTYGTSSWTLASFTTILFLDPPQLIEPANAAPNVSNNSIFFDWSNVTNAATYTIEVATDMAFTNIVKNASGLSQSQTTFTGFDYNTEFFWRVRAENGVINSLWSDVWTFTTMNIPAPVLSLPTNGAVNISRTPVLSWNPVDGANSYVLWVADNADFNNYTEYDLTSTSQQLPTLLYLTTYHWKVKAIQGTWAMSDWSEAWNFTTVNLAAPILLAPANNATNQILRPNHQWTSVNGANMYMIQISSNPDFTSPLEYTTVNLSFTLPTTNPLNYNTLYHWRVRAMQNSTLGNWSSVFNFTTINIAAPTLVSPANSATNQPILETYTWSPVVGADSYTIEISNSSSFATILESSTVTGTSFTSTTVLDYNKSYFWHVRSMQGTWATSSWASTRSFTTMNIPSPVLITPENGALNQLANGLVLEWSSVNGATSYEILFADNSLFNNPVTYTSTTTNYTLPTLDYNKTYYWKVRALQSTWATGNYSSFRNFTTENIGTPVTLLPVNGALGVSRTPTLTWEGVAGATGYEIELNGNTINIPNSNTSFTLSNPLLYNSLYTWKIRAKQGTWAVGAWSETADFTTLNIGAPILYSPANNSLNQSTSVTVTWLLVSGATGYTVFLADNPAFNNATEVELTGLSNTFSDLNYNTTYFWYVVAHQGNWATSPATAIWNFTTMQIPTPVLLTPDNAATEVALTVDFTWNDVPLVTGYTLTYADNSAFDGAVTIETTSPMATVDGLFYSTTYYWNVVAHQGVNSSQTSETWHFTTMTFPTPMLYTPISGAVGVSINPSFTWSEIPAATMYMIEISSDPSFANEFLWEQTEVSMGAYTFDIYHLDYNSTYYWRIKAMQGTVESAWSEVWSFTTENIPAPELVTPLNGATDVSINTSVTWNPVNYANNYEVFFADNAGFVGATSSFTTSTETSLGTLNYNTTYFWKVVAYQGTWASNASTAWSFTTENIGTPTLTSPINGATVLTRHPDFDWSPVPGATGYEISFNGSIISIVGNITTYHVAEELLFCANYTWQVRALQGTWAVGAWSDLWSFNVMQIPAPTLVSPINGSINVSIMPTIEWTAVAGATSYTVQIGDMTFESPVNSITINNPLPYATLFTLKVKANQGTTCSSNWSAQQVFTTIAIPTPTLVSPFNAAIGVSLRPTFTWEPIAGITQFTLQVSTTNGFLTTLYNVVVTGNSYQLPAALGFNAIYFWRVNAVQGTNSSNWSIVRNFQTETLPAPVLISPTNNATNIDESQNVDFTWSDVSVDSYTLRIAIDAAFTSVIFTSPNWALTTYTLNSGLLIAGHTYYWQVRANMGSTYSLWSAPFQFSTRSFTSPSFTLTDDVTCSGGSYVFPAVTVTGGSGNYTYLWSTVPTTANLTNRNIASPTWLNPTTTTTFTLRVTDIVSGLQTTHSKVITVNSRPNLVIFTSDRRAASASHNVNLNRYINTINGIGTSGSPNYTLPAGYTSYWTKTTSTGGNFLIPNQTYNFTATGLHTFHVFVTNTATGCVSSTLTCQIFITAGREFMFDENADPTVGNSGLIYSYPTPATSFVNVQIPFNTKVDMSISLIDMSGRVYKSFTVENTDLYEGRIELDDLPAGIYFLEVNAGGEQMVRKIIKE